MIDDAGAAPAATEPTYFQNDVASQETAVERSQETARSSLDRAFAVIDAQENEPSGSVGKRAPAGEVSQSVSSAEAPARFSIDARAVWNDVPDAVKGEVGRAIRELEGGLMQYQQAFEPLKPYFQMAQQSETTIQEALERYTALDGALISEKPEERLRAIESVLGYAGVTPHDYAQYILNQKPDEAQARSDQTIRALRQELADLRNQLGGVSRSIQQRHADDALRQVEAFAAENPRLHESDLQLMIVRLLETQMADTLQSAYEMAERLIPAPVAGAPLAAPVAANRRAGAAQTRNGNLSVTGAPGSGSNPAKRKAPSSARESVDSAFTSLGLG
ncbi:hypothetical protein G5V57_18705 [Nordella sp. HKS 07]|uniref:hypothetical protein n=1 Tax=Nordella sp. HKS 07 TaxID=2712222 RepID=UPI0013E107FE|nr:hypothetical protein [Nordella sp. HKS 07]QIG49563.1 hypothetical protein G5V57_18705 [Nordella sp. HKS 07]